MGRADKDDTVQGKEDDRKIHSGKGFSKVVVAIFTQVFKGGARTTKTKRVNNVRVPIKFVEPALNDQTNKPKGALSIRQSDVD